MNLRFNRCGEKGNKEVNKWWAENNEKRIKEIEVVKLREDRTENRVKVYGGQSEVEGN